MILFFPYSDSLCDAKTLDSIRWNSAARHLLAMTSWELQIPQARKGCGLWSSRSSLCFSCLIVFALRSSCCPAPDASNLKGINRNAVCRPPLQIPHVHMTFMWSSRIYGRFGRDEIYTSNMLIAPQYWTPCFKTTISPVLCVSEIKSPIFSCPNYCSFFNTEKIMEFLFIFIF